MSIDSRLAVRFRLPSIQLGRITAADGLIEGALTTHNEGIDAWLEEQMETLESTDPDDEEFLSYLHHEQKAEAADAYPFILRSALFGTAYGIFEFFLVSVCKELEKEVKGPKLGDLRGEGIQRAHLFLESVAGVAMPNTDEWQTLILYGKLRNAIMHAQGDLTGNSNLEAIKQLQRKAQTFILSKDDSAVFLNKGFAPTFVKTVEQFADNLDSAMARSRTAV
jgi:hypothetical protein